MKRYLNLLGTNWKVTEIKNKTKGGKALLLVIEVGYVETTLENLLRVAEYFGTNDINFNRYDVEMCGSRGGERILELEVFNITKNFVTEEFTGY